MSGQRNETQGYSLALSCLNQRDYSKGIQHALQYVNTRPGDVRVHELLGQLYEGKKDWKKAIESYKTAIQLDPQKTKLGLKVVALYCKLPDEIERLRYWTNQASKKYNNDPVIHEAWEFIFKGTKQLDKYTDYLRKQLLTDPHNSLFNVKLLDCLMAQRRLAEASEQLDAMLDILHNDEIALQQIASTSEKLLSEGAPSSSVNLLTSLCYMTQTCLANSNKTSSQCLELLMRLGQKCTELEPKLNKVDGVFKYPCQGLYMSEFRGQFYYLVGTYLLQLGLAGTLAANDFLSMTTALYSLSLREDAIRRNNLINMGWKPLHARIISRLSCNRFGQIGHFLRNVSENHGEEYMDDCQRKWCNVEGRREVLSQAFGAGGNSQFVRSSSFLFPREHEIVSQSDLDGLLNDLFEVNQESVAADPENFQLLVWTCLQWDTRPDGIPSDFGYFVEETFSKLAFSTNKLKIMTIDNLKILDIEAFVYAVVLVVRAMFASQEMKLIGSLKIRQKNLPLLALKQKLKLKEQEEWFSAIHSLCHSKGSTRGYGKLRVIAQRGLEVLRCGSNHNNETQVLVQLGRIMNERRLELVRADGEGDRSRAYHAMSVMYWTEAIGHLKRLQNNGTLLRPQKAFFPHVYKDIKKEEIKEYIDEGSVVLADFFSQNGDLERGLSYLEEVKSSEGLFVKASMYKQLADKESVSNLEYQLSPTKLTDRGELLDKAKHSLFETMDSISGRANHPLHEQVKTLLADIEQEQDDVAGKIAEMDGSPSPPAIGNDSSIYHSLATPGASMLVLGTNDPSPQRLASEIRSLNLSQLQMERDRDETRRMIELQNKTLDQNQSMMEQQNKLVEHILNMTPVVQGESHPNPRRLAEGSGDSSVLKKISEQNEKLFEVMNTMKTQFADLKKDVVDLKEKMSKLELEQQKNKERELHKPSVKPPSQTPPSVASPAPIQMGMPAATMMPSHKHLYQQPLYHHSGITYVPHPQYPGYVVPIDSGFHPGMMTSTPAMRRSGTPQTALPVYTGLYDHGGSPTEEDEELKQQFGKADLGLGEQRMYQDTPGQSLLTSSSQYPKMPSSGAPMRSMLGSWQSPSGVGGSILSGAVPTHSPKTLGMQGQKMDAASTVAAFAAAAGQRQQLPTMGAQPMASSVTAPKPIATSVPNMGGQPSVSTHSVPKPIVTSMSTAKPSSQDLLIKSPTPASQLSAVQSTKSEGVSQSPFAGFSFSKGTSSSSGFMSNPAFQSPKPAIGQPAPTTSNTASPFAGLSFKPSSTKADNFSQPTAGGSSAAQQYPQLTALLAHGGTTGNQEESDPDSPRPGFFAPSQPSESATRKPGQSPMNLKTQTSSPPKETEKSPAQIQEVDDEDVVFVAEKQATPEQISKAEKLFLPRHFYLYEEKPPCSGCRGCDEEDLKAKKGVVDSGPQPPKESTLFVEKPKVSAAPTTGLFSNSTFSGLTFASLSADGDAGFRKSDSSKTFTFANAGAQVFGSKQDNDNASEDPEYDPHYEPIVSLPEKVDLKTGDEGEEVVFRERSRLYRFDRATNVWKERGVGEMKILKNPDTGRTRILMRREQVLKVCANHWLTPNMKLERMSTSDRAWVWFALDFAEGEECHEQFAIKFKTPSLAEEFKETFDRMKQVGSFTVPKPSEAEEQDQLVPQEQQEEKTQTKEEEEKGDAKEEEEEEDMSHRFQVADPVVTHPQEDGEDQGEYEGEYDDDDGDEDQYEDYDEEDYDDEDDDDGDYDDEDEYEEDDDEYDAKYDAKPSLADQFKPPAGSWECDTCMIQNKPETTSCAACQSLKPGTTAAPGTSTGSNFSFGGSKPAGGPFTLAPGAFNFQPPSSFSFSSNPSAFSAGTSSTAFKMPASSFSFGPASATPVAASSSSGSAGFTLPSTFSFAKPESSDSPAGSSAVKGTTAAPFSFPSMSGASTLAGTESVKSSADSTTRDAQPGKPSDQTSIQSSSAATSAPSSTFTFKPEMTQFSFGSPGQSKPSSGFSFGGSPKGVSSGVSSSSGTNQAPTAASQSPMAFGGGNQATPVFGGASSSSTTSAFQGFSFNTKPSSSSSDPPGDKKEAMSFSELVKSQGQFNFRLDVNNVASSPPKSTAKSPSKSPGLNKSGEYYQDEERDDIYFEPVVTLPENVKLETGEEGEEIKFSHRAKLYRFDQEGSQWKERGVGDIKVLYNPETKKHRIVMRREQVLKVCANHYITEHVDLQPNKGSDRSWVWHAMDISDGDVQNEQLAVRFKTEEAAKGFKDAVTKAKQEL